MWRSKQAPSGTLVLNPPPSFPLPGASTVEAKTSRPPDLAAQRNISGNENLSIDGAIEGPISLKCHTLTVGRTARVKAEVIAHEVIVYGKLSGNLRAGNRIEIKKDGSVVGDLTAARILIEDGAYFKGKVQIERRKTPRN
jgi:cytoskeletal protein CcmA (bactofilin family)